MAKSIIAQSEKILDPALARTVFNNLRKSLIDTDLSSGDHENFQQLLNGFLSNEIFQNALLSGLSAEDNSLASEIADKIIIADNSEVSATSGVAYYLVDEMVAGNLEELPADLINGYTPPNPKPVNFNITRQGLINFEDYIAQHDESEQAAIYANPAYLDIVSLGVKQSAMASNAMDDAALIHTEAKTIISQEVFDPAAIDTANQFYARFIETQAPHVPIMDSPTRDAREEVNLPNSDIIIPNETAPVRIRPLHLSAFPSAAANIDAAPSVNKDTPAPPMENKAWNDDAIVSTYEELLTLNPESVTKASPATQEAYAIVKPIIAGQKYLESVGLNESGTGFIAPETDSSPLIKRHSISERPSTEAPKALAEPSNSDTSPLRASFSNSAKKTDEVKSQNETPLYKVEKGDNLWKIAKREFGLTKTADIMRAVDHIAIANGMADGADANHIKIGQELKMPTAAEIKTDVTPGDWKARDADVAAHKTGGHYAHSENLGLAAAPSM